MNGVGQGSDGERLTATRGPWAAVRVLRSLPALGLLILALPSAGASVFTSSSSGRFLVVGPDSARNAGFTRWAEATAAQCETLLGVPLPFSRTQPLELVLTESAAPGMTVSAVRREGGAVVLAIAPAVGVDHDALHDAFVLRMLCAVVEGRRQGGGKPVADREIPPWLVAGLAGNLDRGQLAWHRSLLAASGADQELTPIADVLGWTTLPAGWHGPRALCSLATAWILGFNGAQQKLLDRLAAGEALSPQWLAEKVVGVGSVPRLESQWRAWRIRQDRTIQEFGTLSSGLIRELRALLPLPLHEPFSGEPAEIVGASRRRLPGLAALAQEKIQQIRTLTLGKAPEFVAAGERYCLFYDGVARGAWSITLRHRLAAADAALARLETVTVAREAYLDTFEARQAAPGSRENKVGAGLEKTAVESYLDDAEKKFDKP